MKKIFSAFAVIVLAFVIGAVWYLWTPQAPKPDLDVLKAQAEQYDTRIIRDEWGVPHIFGAEDPDAAFGLAYAHAEDDWETIQETLLFVNGTLAQHKGKPAAITDYLVRLLKVQELVDRKYETDLKPETRAVVEAYADGINLWAAENTARVLPGVLPVTGKDVVSGFVARTPFFFGVDDFLTEINAPTRQNEISENRYAGFLADGTPEPLIGSNAFALAPSRAADDHTRLLVNSHQPFTGPVAWYEAHIVSGSGWNVLGGLFPGTPFPTVGVNPDLGWAHTVNQPDLVDIYVLETDNASKPTRYMLDGEWRAFERTTASFRVRLNNWLSVPVNREVLWSEHGPVLVTDHGVYAVRFAGMDDIRAVEQWYEMGKARSYDAWLQAMESQGFPSFNTVYADREGNIGFYYNARTPRRDKGWDWQKYLPGDRSDLIWGEYHAFEDTPQVVNPPSGWVFSANNTPFKGTDDPYNPDPKAYPDYFGMETHLTNRAKRALALYAVDPEISEQEFLSYRADTYYAEDSAVRAVVSDILLADFEGDSDLEAAQAILRDWDGSTNIDDRATALAVLTSTRARGYLIRDNMMDSVAAFRSVVTDLLTRYGRVDPEWGEVNRLIRGETSLALSGGPDILRAVYGEDRIVEDGIIKAAGGDTYILYADWDSDGALSVQTIHQFGSATLDDTSSHYADQAALFAAGEYKSMPMTLEGVLPNATRDYRPGRKE